jgi:hypothetical protein
MTELNTEEDVADAVRDLKRDLVDGWKEQQR